MQIEAHLLVFYGWWQFAVCLFAFFALVSIWYHIGRKQGDKGQLLLALSVLCWSFSGVFEVYFANASLVDNHALEDSFLRGYRSIFSLLNSLFILLALPWFKYIPLRLESVIKSNYWKYIVGIPFLFSLMPALLRIFSGQEQFVIIEFDVYYSFFTLGFLAVVLYESFLKRRMPMLAYLSIVCVLITLFAEILKLTGTEPNMILMSAIFKTSLIMIFFALAMSWVKEISENVIPAAQRLFIQLNVKKNKNGKFDHLVKIDGIPNKDNLSLRLTPANFNLLQLFAQRKLDSENEWLEIKPKSDSRTGKLYDINDHNEIKRMTHSLLDGIFGKQMWTKEQHEFPLKNELFEMSEKRERKIRLKIPASNITILQ